MDKIVQDCKDFISHSLSNYHCLKKTLWLLTIAQLDNKERLILIQKFQFTERIASKKL